jgi:hypothetical protein
MEVGLTREL